KSYSIPSTLECVVGVYLSINIENFTNNNNLLFCQLSKLLKSKVLLITKSHFLRTFGGKNPNHAVLGGLENYSKNA
ncbi:hypothetical protein, partial [Vibrio cholerae]|uniref:hypothetical protein n=2 Tax=Vibrio cholerae TaxID=666 RepID=UPI001E296D97